MVRPNSEDAGSRQPDPHPGVYSALCSVLDELDDAFVLLRSTEHPCYRNEAARAMLERDRRGDVLEVEMRAVSRLAKRDESDEDAIERRVGTADGSYRLRAKLLRDLVNELRSRTVLVLIERVSGTVKHRPH